MGALKLKKHSRMVDLYQITISREKLYFKKQMHEFLTQIKTLGQNINLKYVFR